MVARVLVTLLVVLLCGLVTVTDAKVSSAGEIDLVLIENAQSRGAVCNDGSAGGYYIKKGSTSTFHIHLQGGWWCWDNVSCSERKEYSPGLVSSKAWPSKMWIGGWFSDDASQNNFFYDATSAYIGYCSSDMWAGDGEGIIDHQTWQFRGKNIIRAVFEDLYAHYGLSSATQILFSGCSAGGQGIIVNSDFGAQIVDSLGLQNVKFRTMADAGWLVNMIPYNSGTVSVLEQLQQGYTLWGGVPDDDCALANPGYEYLCFFSTFGAPYIQTPILVHTEQYDPWQTSWNCCNPPFKDPHEWSWVTSFRTAVSHSLLEIKPPSTVFSGACYHHCLTEGDGVFFEAINGNTLNDVIGEWFFDLKPVPLLIDDCKGFNCSAHCPSGPW